jgi:hypothetical protein
MTYSEIAEMLLEQFETKSVEKCEKCGNKRDDFVCFTDKALGIGVENHVQPKWHEELSDIINDAECSSDYAYLFVQESLEAIRDAEPENEDALLDIDIEPPCYTSDLTAFLAAHSNNAVYLENAMETNNGNFGEILAQAYSAAQREVFRSVADLVVKIGNEQDKE